MAGSPKEKKQQKSDFRRDSGRSQGREELLCCSITRKLYGQSVWGIILPNSSNHAKLDKAPGSLLVTSNVVSIRRLLI
jgi:hypothetical protein